jgi:hypothetical protein
MVYYLLKHRDNFTVGNEFLISLKGMSYIMPEKGPAQYKS